MISEQDDTPVSTPVADDGDGLVTGTAAFDALFAALEHSVPVTDLTGPGLLGSNLAPFG